MADLRAKLLELLDGHLRLAEAATPGPWMPCNGEEDVTTVCCPCEDHANTWNGEPHPEAPHCGKCVLWAVVDFGQGISPMPNAEWIAASRSFAPMALRALREEVERHKHRPVTVRPPWCFVCDYGTPFSTWPCGFLLRVATALGVEREGE